MRRARNTSARGGYTLVEMVIVALLLGAALAAFFGATSSATRSYGAGTVRAHTESQARWTIDRIARELSVSGASVVFPAAGLPLGSEVLNYRKPLGVDDDAELVWGEIQRLEFRRAANEVDNGLDDDSDQLIDEAEIVWTRDPGGPDEQSTTWCRDVREYLEGEIANTIDDNGNGLIDEPGFCFAREGNAVHLYLTLERRDPEKRFVTVTVETTVNLGNP